jgi:hypothetical protein
MDFTQYNKNTFEKIEWNVNTSGFTFKKLSDFYSQGIKTIQVFGFFFTKSENYGLQPVAITKDCLLNLPTHKKDVISDMLKNADCVNAIKNGECSLKLREYKSKYGKLCYDFDFVDTPKTETTETTETTDKQADILF